jgi:ATP-dependent Clp protease adapter protein ClpS
MEYLVEILPRLMRPFSQHDATFAMLIMHVMGLCVCIFPTTDLNRSDVASMFLFRIDGYKKQQKQ